MAESLLSFSEVLLFGRVMDDLQIKKKGIDVEARLATIEKLADFNDVDTEIDGVDISDGDLILVRRNKSDQNGVYKVADAGGGKKKLESRLSVPEDGRVAIQEGAELGDTVWRQKKELPKQVFKQEKLRGRGKGGNNFLDAQLDLTSQFARIYGFAYEGTYYELPEPTVFLVHGNGESATKGNAPGNLASRAPNTPSLSGVAAADFQIADDIRVWSYDKADYSIRMDITTGMLEQILLDIYFGFDSPAISGAKVSGAKVSGAKVSGAKVSGAKVSGAKVSGAKARGSGD